MIEASLLAVIVVPLSTNVIVQPMDVAFVGSDSLNTTVGIGFTLSCWIVSLTATLLFPALSWYAPAPTDTPTSAFALGLSVVVALFPNMLPLPRENNAPFLGQRGDERD